MPVFTVHEPPHPPADRLQRAERMVFVRDGFRWGAAIIGPLWLALRRRWRELMLWAVAAAVIVSVLLLVGARAGWIVLGLLALNVFLGYEAGDLERDGLAADGWSSIGLADGRDEADAERDFFDRWLRTDGAGAQGSGAR